MELGISGGANEHREVLGDHCCTQPGTVAMRRHQNVPLLLWTNRFVNPGLHAAGEPIAAAVVLFAETINRSLAKIESAPTLRGGPHG